MRVLRGRNREENEAFAAFRGALALHVEFAAPAKGNEKGGVEGAHGFIEDNFFRPTPSFADLDELNAALARFCESTLNLRTRRTRRRSVNGPPARNRHFVRSQQFYHGPAYSVARVNKFAEVCFERNLYSVPTRFAHRDAVIKVYEDRLQVIVGEEAVAQHRRGFGAGERFLIRVTTWTSCSINIVPLKLLLCYPTAAFQRCCTSSYKSIGKRPCERDQTLDAGPRSTGRSSRRTACTNRFACLGSRNERSRRHRIAPATANSPFACSRTGLTQTATFRAASNSSDRPERL